VQEGGGARVRGGETGVIMTWGRDADGQLGNGAPLMSMIPLVPRHGRALAMAAGRASSGSGAHAITRSR